jgi:hypothetical protein
MRAQATLKRLLYVMGTINTEHKMSICIGRIDLARTLVNIRELARDCGIKKTAMGSRTHFI